MCMPVYLMPYFERKMSTLVLTSKLKINVGIIVCYGIYYSS